MSFTRGCLCLRVQYCVQATAVSVRLARLLASSGLRKYHLPSFVNAARTAVKFTPERRADVRRPDAAFIRIKPYRRIPQAQRSRRGRFQASAHLTTPTPTLGHLLQPPLHLRRHPRLKGLLQLRHLPPQQLHLRVRLGQLPLQCRHGPDRHGAPLGH